MKAAVFAIPEANHFRSLGTVVAELVAAGVEARVYGHADYAHVARAAGAEFVDVYARFPRDAVDAVSKPNPARQVTWAAAHADELLREVAAFGADLVVADAFAVIGRIASTVLELPYACIIPGHNMDPARVVPALYDDPRLALAPACHEAAERLRERYGWEDASPFAYYHLSPDLNVYGEPAGFLPEGARAAFEPVAFWGSLPPAVAGTEPRAPQRPARRVYAAMGTISWRYYPDQCHAALRAVAEAARARGLEAVLSLGGTDVDERTIAALEAPNVRVARWLDQFEELRSADVFVTHCGRHSVHEACLLGVPMIAYPCFGDQPGMAARCDELGVAVPLAGELLGAVSADDVEAALDRAAGEAPAMDAALERARRWELETIAGRPAVVERIMAL